MLTLINQIKKYWIALTLIILTAITFLSLWPADALPAVPGTDKTHHFIAYASLMFPTAMRKPAHWIIYGCMFLAYSGAIELIQPYFNRCGEWMDFLANGIGLLCGLLIAALLQFIISRSGVTE